MGSGWTRLHRLLPHFLAHPHLNHRVESLPFLSDNLEGRELEVC